MIQGRILRFRCYFDEEQSMTTQNNNRPGRWDVGCSDSMSYGLAGNVKLEKNGCFCWESLVELCKLFVADRWDGDEFRTRRVDIVISALLLTASDCVGVQMMLNRLSRALLDGTEERTTSSVRYSSAVRPLVMLAFCTCSASKNARRLGHWNFLTCSIFSQSPTPFIRSVQNSRTSSHTSPQNATSAFVFATFSVPASYEGTVTARSPAPTPSCSSPTPSKRSRTRSFCLERGLVYCGRCFKGPRRTRCVPGRRFSCLLPSSQPWAATEQSRASQRERRIAQLRVCHLTEAPQRRRTSAPSHQRAAIRRFPTVRLQTLRQHARRECRG